MIFRRLVLLCSAFSPMFTTSAVAAPPQTSPPSAKRVGQITTPRATSHGTKKPPVKPAHSAGSGAVGAAAVASPPQQQQQQQQQQKAWGATEWGLVGTTAALATTATALLVKSLHNAQKRLYVLERRYNLDDKAAAKVGGSGGSGGDRGSGFGGGSGGALVMDGEEHELLAAAAAERDAEMAALRFRVQALEEALEESYRRHGRPVVRGAARKVLLVEGQALPDGLAALPDVVDCIADMMTMEIPYHQKEVDVTDFNTIARSCCAQYLVQWRPEWILQDARPSGKLIVELRFGDHGPGSSSNGGSARGGSGGGSLPGGGSLNGGGTTGGATDIPPPRLDDENGNGLQGYAAASNGARTGISTDNSSGANNAHDNSNNHHNNNNHVGGGESVPGKFDWMTRRKPRPLGDWLKGRGDKGRTGSGDKHGDGGGAGKKNGGDKNSNENNNNNNNNGQSLSWQAEELAKEMWRHVFPAARAASSSALWRPSSMWGGGGGGGKPFVALPRRW